MLKKRFIIPGLGIATYLLSVGIAHYFDNAIIEKKMTQLNTENMSSLDQQAFKIFTEKGCQYCHSENHELPFYANFPIAKTLMQDDVTQGLRHFEINPLLNALEKGERISDTNLAKVERVLIDKTMPPDLYLTMHWASSMSETERQTLLEWVKKTRQDQHPNNPAQEAFKNDPVQPIYTQFEVDEKKAELGFALFHDPRLSSDNSISCASCHGLTTGGVDNLTTSKGVGGAIGPINAPTVFNAVFNTHQFWDGRAADLQEQAGGPPLNPIEMASSSWKEIIDKLNQDPTLRAQFDSIYPEGITEKSITNSIQEFEKTLTTPNSPFDQYLKGNEKALTPEEIEGYVLFNKYKCSTCHAGEAMGGESFEYMGLKEDYFAARGKHTDADLGRFNASKKEIDKHKFKVPTLRNINLTAPYFHDGSAATLKEAVASMAKYQVGVTLTDSEIDKITAYLNALTGEHNGKSLN